MAILIDATSEQALRTANLPSSAAWTACMWYYLDTNAAGSTNIIYLTTATEASGLALTSGGNLHALDSTFTGTSTIVTLSTSAWHFVGLRQSSGNLTGLHRTFGTSLATQSISNTLTGSLTNLIFGAQGANFATGRLAAMKFWDADLSDAEIAAEWLSTVPKRLNSLNEFWPGFPGATERLAGYSKGRNFTANGTLSDAAGPPISWGGAPIIVYPVVTATAAAISSVNGGSDVTEGDTGVAIVGTGFGASQGDGSVTILGVSATVTSWSDTSVEITVPTVPTRSGNGLAEVIVTPDSGGLDASGAFSFTLISADTYLGSIDANLSATIVAHWTCDDQSGTTLADRMGDHDGTLVNTPTLDETAIAPSSGNSAIRFIAADSEYAEVSHNAAFATAAGSICGWCKPPTLENNTPVVSKNGSTPAANDLLLQYDANGQVTLSIWNATPTELTIQSPTGYIAAGVPFHWLIYWDASGYKLYIDGNEVGTEITSYTNGLQSNTRDWRFAAEGD